MKIFEGICKICLIALVAFLVFNMYPHNAYSQTPQAKSSAPKPDELAPVIYNGVKYVAPHIGWRKGRGQNGGYVEAWDVKTNKMLWELKVYEVKYDPRLEQDVQENFITSLSIENGKLIVVNQKGEVYEVDLKTKTVQKR